MNAGIGPGRRSGRMSRLLRMAVEAIAASRAAGGLPVRWAIGTGRPRVRRTSRAQRIAFYHRGPCSVRRLVRSECRAPRILPSLSSTGTAMPTAPFQETLRVLRFVDRRAQAAYRYAATELGTLLATSGIELVYGGGARRADGHRRGRRALARRRPGDRRHPAGADGPRTRAHRHPGPAGRRRHARTQDDDGRSRRRVHRECRAAGARWRSCARC